MLCTSTLPNGTPSCPSTSSCPSSSSSSSSPAYTPWWKCHLQHRTQNLTLSRIGPRTTTASKGPNNHIIGVYTWYGTSLGTHQSSNIDQVLTVSSTRNTPPPFACHWLSGRRNYKLRVGSESWWKRARPVCVRPPQAERGA